MSWSITVCGQFANAEQTACEGYVACVHVHVEPAFSPFSVNELRVCKIPLVLVNCTSIFTQMNCAEKPFW